MTSYMNFYCSISVWKNWTKAAITESLESADSMTKQMENILANFGSRLTKLEEAVIPIHKQTKDLQRLQGMELKY